MPAIQPALKNLDYKVSNDHIHCSHEEREGMVHRVHTYPVNKMGLGEVSENPVKDIKYTVGTASPPG